VANLYRYAGGTLNDPAIFAMILHLAVGDTWNSINNVERRLGTAVLGVCAVLLSVYNVVFQYYRVLPTAG
jgi:benzodiazapine receptor